MKTVFLNVFLSFVILFGAACQRHSGTIIGKIIDVSYGGAFIDSCEIVIQKGEGSSSEDQSSSDDKAFCDKASKLVGLRVVITYEHVPISWTTETRDIIKTLEQTK